MRIMGGIVLMLMLSLLAIEYSEAAESCAECHANSQKMREAGYPQFTLSPAEVMAQTHMPASCPDCHFGNPGAVAREEAHGGMLMLHAIRQKTWEAVTRNSMPPEDLKDWPDLAPRGDGRAAQLFPKRMYDGILKDNPDYRTIIYHDKNSDTLAFNPRIAEKTCGKCHAEIVKSYLKSPMGGGTGSHTQSQYGTWTSRSGPQSCGLWLGVLSKPEQDRFLDENVGNYNAHSTLPIAEKVAFNLQRNCNQCHVGCLDCHLEVRTKSAERPGDGPHTFVRKPTPLACYGGGRSFSCHAGPLERRRGDGYIRAEFTQASREGAGLLKEKMDIHMQKNISCVDCHEQNRETGFHGDLRRNATCGKCHAPVVQAHEKGPHRKVDCASCHTALIGGYAFNFWSAVGPKGSENPLTRIQDYQTGATVPLLIQNPKGMWIPVHVVPHLSGNIKAGEVRISKRLLFRNRPDSDVRRLYVSNDSYAVTGLIRNLDDRDHDVMTWLNIDRVAHGIGKARTCESCHASRAQKIGVKFSGGSYKNVENGEYTIIADDKGLRIADMKDDKGARLPDLELLRDAWGVSGKFLLPGLKDRKRYEAIKKANEDGTFSH